MYGSSFENFLVAVVVPKEDHLRTAVEQQGVTDALSMPFQVRVVVLCHSKSGRLWVFAGHGSVPIVGLCRSRSGGLWVLCRSLVCANCGSVPFQVRRVVGLCLSRSGELWVVTGCGSVSIVGLCRSSSGGLWVFAVRGSVPFQVRRVVGLVRLCQPRVYANCGSVPFQVRVIGLPVGSIPFQVRVVCIWVYVVQVGFVGLSEVYTSELVSNYMLR